MRTINNIFQCYLWIIIIILFTQRLLFSESYRCFLLKVIPLESFNINSYYDFEINDNILTVDKHHYFPVFVEKDRKYIVYAESFGQIKHTIIFNFIDMMMFTNNIANDKEKYNDKQYWIKNEILQCSLLDANAKKKTTEERDSEDFSLRTKGTLHSLE